MSDTNHTRHTPGPWNVDCYWNGGLQIEAETDFRGAWHAHGRATVAKVFDTQPGGCGWDTDADGNSVMPPEMLANARLIAAAPDLLEAAQTVLAGLDARIEAAGLKALPVPLFDGIAELHAAIAKATGGGQA